MGMARAWSRSETNNFYLNYYAIQAKIFKICGPNSSHIILFGQSQLPQFCNFYFFALKKRLY